MKYLLCAASLLFVAPALAQVTTPAQSTPAAKAGTIDALDEKNGFRGYQFGVPMEKYPALKKRGDYYTNVSEPLKVGDAGIGSLRFIAYEGKLSAVLFSSFGTENCRRLLAILEAQYGTPQQATYSTRTWVGNVASLVYDEKVSGGLYGTTYTSAIIYIFNNEMAAQQKAIETDKAKKAAQTGL